MTAEPQQAPTAKGPVLRQSRGLCDWLEAQNCSLAFTTYQGGVLFLIGRNSDGTLRAQGRQIERCQGLWTDGQTLLASGRHTMWRFENVVPDGSTSGAGIDRLFMPREGRVTGGIDIHDISMGDLGQFGGASGRGPIFVATTINALATLSETDNVRPLWKPPFISDVVVQDRCHLNGLAMDGDRAAFVTVVGQTNEPAGWREHRQSGGAVLDVATGEPVATGLSMPHSPRLYDGRLWVLNSGMGELSVVDPADGTVTPVALCPGFARGLSFIGRYAVVGLSQPRNNNAFEDIPLEDRLRTLNTPPRCGFMVIDIDSGKMVDWLVFEHTINELYDMSILPDVVQPELYGFDADDHIVSLTKLEASGI